MAEILTGNKIVDSLQELQRRADKLDTTDEKIECFNMAWQPLGAHRLLGSSLMISTSLALGSGPDMPPDELYQFDQGLMFTGKVEQFDYLDYPFVPIDSVGITVEQPAIFADDPSDIDAFSRLKLRIPILAIETCISLDLE